MLWNFATGAKVFVYQSAVLALGYAYGTFDAKDLFRIRSVLTIVEALILMLVVSLYGPLIGVHWRM